MKEEGAPSTPKLATPSPQTTPRQKEPTALAGPGMLRTSPQVVLKNISPKGHERLRVTPRIHLARGSQVSQPTQGGSRGALTAGKSAEGPGEAQLEESPRYLPG